MIFGSRHLSPLVFVSAVALAAPGAARIERSGNKWIIDTGVVQKTVQVADGTVLLASFTQIASGRQYVNGRQKSPEVRLSVDDVVISGLDPGWTVVADDIRKLPRGEWQLDLKIRRGAVELEKHYVAYAGTPVIREDRKSVV